MKLDNSPAGDLSHELVHDRIDDKLLEKLIELYEADPKSIKNKPIRKIFGFGRSKSFKKKEPSDDNGLLHIENEEEQVTLRIFLDSR